MLALTILGCNSAIAAYGRNPTAQVLQSQDESFLIDCGEGTQMQMAKYKVKRSRISHIFISHLHGDHYFGLIGLLTSMGLLNRTQPIHLHAPAPLEKIIELQLNAADTKLPYKLHFHPLNKTGVIASTPAIEVTAFPVKHRIDCWGFTFREIKKPRKIEPDRISSYGVPTTAYHALQMGEDFVTAKGTIIPNDELTTAASRPRIYAYCADTVYNEDILPYIAEADLIYHEATYLKELEERAAARFHSTTVQAGTIAKKAGAKKLIIGHFSSKYEILDPFLEETCSVFPNTELAVEGSCFKV
ncbi:MAG: ribonuclease Z [Chitinophagaceae bacterium]|nr:MAG: ribonuclease Z [Chitinophagaceae bacterium]